MERIGYLLPQKREKARERRAALVRPDFARFIGEVKSMPSQNTDDMSTLLRTTIHIPKDDRAVYWPTYRIEKNHAQEDEHRIIAFGYRPDTNRQLLKTTAQHVHDQLQTTLYPPLPYSVEVTAEWITPADFLDEKKLPGTIDKLQAVFDAQAEGNVRVETNTVWNPGSGEMGSKEAVDVSFSGKYSSLAPELAVSFKPTHVAVELSPADRQKIAQTEVMAHLEPQFDSNTGLRQWSDRELSGIYLVGLEYFDAVEQTLVKPLLGAMNPNDSRVIGLRKEYPGKRIQKQVDTLRDVQLVVQAADKRKGDFAQNPDAVCSVQLGRANTLKYEKRIPPNTRVTEIGLYPKLQSDAQGRLVITNNTLNVSIDLDDPRLHHLQSSALAQAGITF